MSDLNANEILIAAAEAIADRAAERDVEQERSAATAVDIFNAWTGHDLSELDGWKFMMALKMARAGRGKFQIDDWVDLAGYAGLAGECAAKTVEPGSVLRHMAFRLGLHDYTGFQEPSEQVMRSYGGTCDD